MWDIPPITMLLSATHLVNEIFLLSLFPEEQFNALMRQDWSEGCKKNSLKKIKTKEVGADDDSAPTSFLFL
jgi:hypothetical protein